MSKAVLIVASCVLLIGARVSAEGRSSVPEWRIQGDFTEACSCTVPCSCNFGEGPSPHHFCYALFSLDIKDGSYGDVRLDGVKLAGALGGKGLVYFIDSKATKEQADALKSIARITWEKAAKANGIKDLSKPPAEFMLLGVKRAEIDQVVGDRSHSLKIGNLGGFKSAYILGIDGKTPVKVENNWSWNVTDGIKAKTSTLHYKDGYGNDFSFKATNANQGKFDWSDKTPLYFR